MVWPAALGVQFKLSQFADDTAVFLKNKFEVSKTIRYIEEFMVFQESR